MLETAQNVNLILDTGYKIQDTRRRMCDAGYKIQDAGCWLERSGNPDSSGILDAGWILVDYRSETEIPF
jgi:hypothetical protein